MIDYFKYIIDLLIRSEKESTEREDIRPTLQIEEPEQDYQKEKTEKEKKSSVIIIDI